MLPICKQLLWFPDLKGGSPSVQHGAQQLPQRTPDAAAPGMTKCSRSCFGPWEPHLLQRRVISVKRFNISSR